MTLTQIPEQGRRLGRHVEHDPRSLNYPYEAPRKVTLRTIAHARVGTLFDQGMLGSCTGNAIAGACNTRPLFDSDVHPVLVEHDAVAAYTLATEMDGFPGTYPPDDTGSSGLAACKAAKYLGWITAYHWAFDVPQALQALMVGPVITGVNWYEGFDHPAADGLVKISGQVRGGHEFVVRGYDANRKRVWADNSWGTSWGLKGRFCFTLTAWRRLLAESGDVSVPVRL